MEKKNKIKILIIITFITLALTINLSKPQTSYIENLVNLNPFLALFAFIGIYKIVLKRYGKEKNNKVFFYFSLLISFVNIIAYNYHYYSSLEYLFTPAYQIIKAIIVLIGQSFMYYYLISYINRFLIIVRKKKPNNKFIKYIFEEHPIKSTIVILILCYIPLIFFTYPGDMSPDGFDELKQFYHIKTWSIDYINLLNDNIYINTHHSVLHTIMIGCINEVGNIISSPNFGLFLNVMFQAALTIFVLAYCMNTMKKIKTPIYIRIGVMLFYICSGFILIPSTAIYKDVPFSLLVLLYSTMLMEFIYKDEKNNIDIIKLSIVALLMSLMAKKGIYAVILIVIALLFFFRKEKYRKSILIMPILIYFVLENILFPAIGITAGSSREMLAIPLQQISRTVTINSEKISQDDKAIINEILEYDEIAANYNPKNADPVKNKLFKKDYTSQEMKEFLILYIKYFFKYPKEYVDAFLNSTSGYFLLGRTIGPGGYSTDTFRMSTKKITYTKSQWRIKIMENIDKIYELIQKTPIINIIYILAIYVWVPLYALVYIICKKDKKDIIALIPAIVMILFLLVSPVNNNRRYVFPLLYTVPMIVAYISTNKKNTNNIYKKETISNT